jgi:hypothetical protein
MVLAAEEIHDPENQRKRDAHYDACNHRKIEAATVAPVIGNVSGQMAQPEGKLHAKHHRYPCAGKNSADNEQQLSEFAHRVHAIDPLGIILPEVRAHIADAHPPSGCRNIKVALYINTYILPS